MHQDVEMIPARFQRGETAGDVLVQPDIHGERDVRAQFPGERHDAVGHALDVRERQFRALAVHGLGDAPGDGPIRGQPDDQRALAGQKSHCEISRWFEAAMLPQPCALLASTYMTSRLPARIWCRSLMPFQVFN
jgi:hypothetical protein